VDCQHFHRCQTAGSLCYHSGRLVFCQQGCISRATKPVFLPIRRPRI
jgi:hypothetical protein